MAFVVIRPFHPLSKKLLNVSRSSRFIRSISTSEKKKDGVTISETIPKDIPDFSKPLENKNWVSFGFDRFNERDDLNGMHSIAFVGITLIMVVGGFFFAYFPDFGEKDWAQREAFLEIRRREQLGLPLIDKNYVDPSLIILPTDEELGDREIII